MATLIIGGAGFLGACLFVLNLRQHSRTRFASRVDIWQVKWHERILDEVDEDDGRD